MSSAVERMTRAFHALTVEALPVHEFPSPIPFTSFEEEASRECVLQKSCQCTEKRIWEWMSSAVERMRPVYHALTVEALPVPNPSFQ